MLLIFLSTTQSASMTMSDVSLLEYLFLVVSLLKLRSLTFLNEPRRLERASLFLNFSVTGVVFLFLANFWLERKANLLSILKVFLILLPLLSSNPRGRIDLLRHTFLSLTVPHVLVFESLSLASMLAPFTTCSEYRVVSTVWS